jgi:hypothetical protein
MDPIDGLIVVCIFGAIAILALVVQEAVYLIRDAYEGSAAQQRRQERRRS